MIESKRYSDDLTTHITPAYSMSPFFHSIHCSVLDYFSRNFLSILPLPPHLPQEGSSGARDFNWRPRVVTNRCWASDVVGAQDEHRMGSQETRAQVDGHLDDDVMTRIIVIVVAHM